MIYAIVALCIVVFILMIMVGVLWWAVNDIDKRLQHLENSIQPKRGGLENMLYANMRLRRDSWIDSQL